MPIYAVSADMDVLFCNDALCQLTDQTDEFLTDLTCVYQTATDQPPSQQLASALCPPPDCFSGNPSTGWICLPADGQNKFHQATFVPNMQIVPADSADCGVIVFVHGPESQSPTVTKNNSQIPEARFLHSAICKLQYESANSISIDCLVGPSPHSQRIRNQVALAGRTDTNLVIVGPTGSGRKKIVPLIHFSNGPELAGPLIPVDCTVSDQEMVQETIKSLYRSHKQYPDEPLGRLFLQDVNKLSTAAQQELVGFLNLPDFQLPLIATTDRNWKSNVVPELWHQLSTIVIQLQELTERREDIPFLVQALVEQFNNANHSQLAGVETQTLSSLTRYSWPGELSELTDVIDYSCRMATTPFVQHDNLPQYLRIALRHEAGPHESLHTSIDLDQFLADIEDELIHRALAHTNGNKSEAARILGISRPRLLRRLDSQPNDIELPDFSEARDGGDQDELD